MKMNDAKRLFMAGVLGFVCACFLSCDTIDYSQIKVTKKENGLNFTPARDISGFQPFLLNGVTCAHAKGRWGVLINVCYRKTSLGPSSFKDVVYFIVVDEDLRPVMKNPLVIYDAENDKDRKSCNIFPTDDGFGFIYTSGQAGALTLICKEFVLDTMKSGDLCAFSFTYPDYNVLNTGLNLLVASYHKGFVYIAKHMKNLDGIAIMRSGRNYTMEQVLDIKKNDPARAVDAADLHVDAQGVRIAWIEKDVSSNSPQCKTPRCAAYYYARCSLDTRTCVVEKLEFTDNSNSYHANLNVKFIRVNNELRLFMQCVDTVWVQDLNRFGERVSMPVKFLSTKSFYKNPDPFPVQVNISQ